MPRDCSYSHWVAAMAASSFVRDRMIIGVDIRVGDFIGILYGMVSLGALAYMWRWANPWR